jgi:hypothetical protein
MLLGVRQCVMIGVAFAFLAVAPASAANGEFSPAEKATMRGYVLTAQKVNGYITAMTAVAAAKKSDRSLGQELEAIENEPNDTLADLRASIGKHPKLLAFFQRQGLTVDDTVLIPFVLTFAGAAAATKNADQFAEFVSPAQLQFSAANPALIKRVNDALTAVEDSDAK